MKTKLRMFLFMCLSLFGCQETKPIEIKIDLAVSDGLVTVDGAVEKDCTDNTTAEWRDWSGVDNDSQYISCGDFGNCPLGYICHNGNLCCPPNLPQQCANQCFSADCECVIDGNIVMCLPVGFNYCGNGVACDGNKEEKCVFVDTKETYYCLTDNQTYCRDDLFCNKETEYCFQQGETSFCVENGKVLCLSGILCEKDEEVCGVNHCCPVVQPQECEDSCCFLDEYCSDCGCLPIGAECCQGVLCVAGETCAPDGLPACYPETGDYCANGRFCEPGMVCTKDSCCPQEQPQQCGSGCCPASYQCLVTSYGKKCIPPGTEPCGDTWCEPDEYCADHKANLCLHDFSVLCADGHVCSDGLFCAGPTCCSEFNPNQSCGSLCCPLNWQCINFGEACIPPGATYIGNGQYCDPGKFYNSENGQCDQIGWEPCGAGPACPPDKACAQDKELNLKQCCPADQDALCGDKCCYSGYKCIHDGVKNVCLPPGSEYCWGANVNEWCPPGTFCGKKGKKCVPIGAMECENGEFCPIGDLCTESSPPCCPWLAPAPCEEECCLINQDCKTVNLKKQCLPKNTQICPGIIINNEILWPDKICYNGDFCEVDQACMSEEYYKKKYSYCGCGYTCAETQNCGGLCSSVCCEKGVAADGGCNLSECFAAVIGQIQCHEDVTGKFISCCHWAGSGGKQEIVDQIKECAAALCKNLNCSGGNQVCCTYDKPRTVGCLIGCIPSGQICYDVPTSNSTAAYLSPIESGFLTKNTEATIGDYCSNADYLSWAIGIMTLGFVTLDVYFNPAGFAENFDSQTGTYHSENEAGEWIQGESGTELLVAEFTWIIDNLEGIDCPHGPYAQLYILIHRKGIQPDLNKPTFAGLKNNTVYGSGAHRLKGPLSGSDTWSVCLCYGLGWLGICFDETCWGSFGSFDSNAEEEWVDYLSIKYSPGQAGVYKWEKGEDEIYFTLREADSPVMGVPRWDDFMGLRVVTKSETKTPGGKMIPLYKYECVAEDDDPGNDGEIDPDGNPYYYKTNLIAGFVRLRTIIVP